MNGLIISAPFGNYIQPRGATATLGTFTLHPRPGRWMQVLRTVRVYPRIGAWVNKIGLRNPGIDSVKASKVYDKILSIHGFDEAEWRALLIKAEALHPLAIELNMSCPNVPGGTDYPEDLFKWAKSLGVEIIVKVPPIRFEAMVEDADKAGIYNFHATNTFPVPAGGLSGKILKPFALDVVRYIRENYRDVTIIGGGGITTPADIDEYREAGADFFAVGTGSLAVWKLRVLAEAANG